MTKKLFEGVKVAQFGWFVVGPVTGEYLGEFGAEVIKIESISRPDPQRLMSPFKGDKIGVNRGSFWVAVNTNTYSVALNLNHLKGMEIAKKIVARADIVIDSFTPGVMAKWGLSYEDLKKINHDIIMLSTCMFGQTGPLSKMPGYGGTLTAMSGINNITGWPDQLPSGPYGAYTDWIVPRFAAFAIIAALTYRLRTGEGQFIDLSQYETALNFVTPLILDYEVNERESNRIGNRSPAAAPYGVYRCMGEDKWCAIAVVNDEEWRNFCQVIGNPTWSMDSKFATLVSRLENADELDGLVEQWTAKRSPEEVMTLMQRVGVAAGVVQSCEDLDNNPQLKHRGYFWNLDHPEIGTHRCGTLGIQLSKTPRELRRAPLLGEHTEYVCTKLLGLSDQEFIQLYDEGVFE